MPFFDGQSRESVARVLHFRFSFCACARVRLHALDVFNSGRSDANRLPHRHGAHALHKSINSVSADHKRASQQPLVASPSREQLTSGRRNDVELKRCRTQMSALSHNRVLSCAFGADCSPAFSARQSHNSWSVMCGGAPRHRLPSLCPDSIVISLRLPPSKPRLLHTRKCLRAPQLVRRRPSRKMRSRWKPVTHTRWG